MPRGPEKLPLTQRGGRAEESYVKEEEELNRKE